MEKRIQSLSDQVSDLKLKVRDASRNFRDSRNSTTGPRAKQVQRINPGKPSRSKRAFARTARRSPSNAYMASLADPFRADAATKIPDGSTYPSIVGAVRDTFDVYSNADGTLGAKVCLYQGKVDGVDAKAFYTYEPITGTDTGLGLGSFTTGTKQYATYSPGILANNSQLRVVSAGVRFQSYATSQLDAGLVTGAYVPRTHDTRSLEIGRVLSRLPKSYTGPAKAGVVVLFNPLDNKDVEYTDTDSFVPSQDDSTECRLLGTFYIFGRGTISGHFGTIDVVVNYEAVPTMGIDGIAPSSPVEPVVLSNVWNKLREWVVPGSVAAYQAANTVIGARLNRLPRVNIA